jgi:hypothetical protein
MVRVLSRLLRKVAWGMRWPLVFFGGYLLNFIFDVQFATGFVAGWLARHGFDGISNLLFSLLY